MKEDLAKLKQIREHGWLMGVNDAGRIVPCNFIFSYHPEKLAGWRAQSIGAPSTHSSIEHRDRLSIGVDYWWQGINSSGTSSLGAVLLLKRWGVEPYEVVLVGCPMNGGDGYYLKQDHKDHRFGMLPPHKGLVRSYREHWATRRDDLEHVYSMSGYTRELLGEPDGIGP